MSRLILLALVLALTAPSMALGQDAGARRDDTTGDPRPADPATDDPTADDPTAGDPATGDPTTADPTTEQATTEQADGDQTATDATATDAPQPSDATDEPATDADDATTEPSDGDPDAPPLGDLSDAGAPDAGAADAGAGAPDAGAVEPAGARNEATLLEQALALVDALRGEDEPAPPPPSQPVTVNTTPLPDVVPVRIVGCDAGLLGLALPERAISTGELILLILLALFAIWILTRLRRPLPERGLLPRLFGLLHLGARIAALVLGLMLLTRLLPGWLRPALLLAIAAAAIAIGAGVVWIVLPDVISGVLLVTEGRVRQGLWITGEGFAGTVERVGPRVTVLHDAEGHRLTVPNRRLVKSAIHVIDRRWPELQLSLRVPTERPAGQVRRAVEDAVLCSPQLPPDPRLSVARDAADPAVWRVNVRLLDVTHRDAFEGQLLERIEEALACTPTVAASSAPGDAAPD